jgi:hypothetical protein
MVMSALKIPKHGIPGMQDNFFLIGSSFSSASLLFLLALLVWRGEDGSTLVQILLLDLVLRRRGYLWHHVYPQHGEP